MGFWIRDKKDGQKTAGYGVYLTVGGLVLVSVIYVAYKLRITRPGMEGPPKTHRSVVNLGDTTEAATGMHETKNAERPKEDYEQSARGLAEAGTPDRKTPGQGGQSGLGLTTVPGRSTGAFAVGGNSSSATAHEDSGQSKLDAPATGGIESINVAMRIAEDAQKPKLDEGGGFFGKPEQVRYAPLPTTVWTSSDPAKGGNAHPRGGQTASSNAMVVYSANQDQVVQEEKRQEAKAQAQSDRTYVLPRGEWIPCYLLTNVESGAFADTIIELGVAENVYFNHRMQVPFGARIFATAGGTPVRMRMGLSANAIRYPNGLELPLTGAVRGEDRTPGVPAYYIAAPGWAQVAPFVDSFLEAWIEAEKSAVRGSMAGTVVGALTGNAPSNPFNPSAEAGIAAATGLNSMLKARFKDVEDRFGGHLVIPAGTKVWVQLTSDANFAEAHKPPAKPWLTVIPDAVRAAAENQTAAASAKGKAAAAAGSTLKGAATSSIDRLMQDSSSGNNEPNATSATPAEKTTRSSVINKPAPATEPADAQDFFPTKTS